MESPFVGGRREACPRVRVGHTGSTHSPSLEVELGRGYSSILLPMRPSQPRRSRCRDRITVRTRVTNHSVFGEGIFKTRKRPRSHEGFARSSMVSRGGSQGSRRARPERKPEGGLRPVGYPRSRSEMMRVLPSELSRGEFEPRTGWRHARYQDTPLPDQSETSRQGRSPRSGYRPLGGLYERDADRAPVAAPAIPPPRRVRKSAPG